MVRQVDAQFVCMIDKRHFDEPQKPVLVGDRTYYVCCEVHATQLIQAPPSRMDIDPVSGKEVDKATAAVGADRVGNVYFFENAENLKQFRVPPESGTSRASHPRR
jgi:YHS domain-containing protein